MATCLANFNEKEAIALSTSKMQRICDPLLTGFDQFKNGDPVDPRWIPRMAELARSSNPDEQARGMHLLEQLLFKKCDSSTVSAVMETGVLETVVNVLKLEQGEGATSVQTNACHVIDHLSSGATRVQLLQMENLGAVPAAVSLLKVATDVKCLNVCAGLLGNCWGDFPSRRAEALLLDMFPTIQRVLLDPPSETNWVVKEWVGWLLVNTLKPLPVPPRGYAQQAAEL
jgi:hypothetical protein